MATTSQISPDDVKMVSEEFTEKKQFTKPGETSAGGFVNEIGESKKPQLKKLV